MPTDVLGIKNDYGPANEPNVITNAWLNLVADEVELTQVQISELIGSPGALAATDFNLTLVGGALSVDVSPGRAVVGPAGGRRFRRTTEIETVTGLAANATNRIWLLIGGAFSVNQSNTPPATGAFLCGTCTTNGTEGTAVDNAPALRINLATYYAVWQEVVAARGSLASVDARLDVSLNENGTLKPAAVTAATGFARHFMTMGA